MKIIPLLSLASLLLAGCATPFRAPDDVAHLKLTRVDSPLVIVDKVWLERKHGPLVVTGYVIKRLESEDTTRTHLDITLYDANDRELRSTMALFEPRQLIRRHRTIPLGVYRAVLDPLPDNTSRVEVRAHEGDHPAGV
jgi:hypothetical protein